MSRQPEGVPVPVPVRPKIPLLRTIEDAIARFGDLKLGYRSILNDEAVGQGSRYLDLLLATWTRNFRTKQLRTEIQIGFTIGAFPAVFCHGEGSLTGFL